MYVYLCDLSYSVDSKPKCIFNQNIVKSTNFFILYIFFERFSEERHYWWKPKYEMLWLDIYCVMHYFGEVGQKDNSHMRFWAKMIF